MILKRIGKILSNKTNKALDSLENPIEDLERAIRVKEQLLNKTKQESASLLGKPNQKDKKIAELKEEILKYDARIKEAKKQNKTEIGIKCLTKKKELEENLKTIEKEREILVGNATKIEAKIKKLEEDIRLLKDKKDSLKGRYSVAKSSAKINEMISDINTDSAVMSAKEIEEKIEEMESYSDGLEHFSKDDEKDIDRELYGSDSSSLLEEFNSYGEED
ncbi:PspA/IM30 family protein [Clostridium perfringens]|nr:PspA/IM30 family protein [Clostridium perfringens]MDK0982944.1 PspA/IM30 family protein [Clostridium perfringens]